MSLRDIAKTHMELNMCMLGSRGVGKTSVMTAIFDESRSSKGLAKSKIAMVAESDTRTELLNKKMDLMEIFENQKIIADSGIAASAAVHTFKFNMGLLGQVPCIDFTVTDYPGEFLISNKDFVDEQIAKSSVIFIAIDSPYLMENNAEYNEQRNHIQLIYDYLSSNVDTLTNKLILLVPLKCEKYFIDRQMELLNARVKDLYADIIDLFQNRENAALAITPILTLGGVKFDHFEDNDGQYIAKYSFVGDNAKFAPMFCVQPIYYMLSFVAKQYIEQRKDVGVWGTILQSIFNVIDKNEKLFEEFVKLARYRIDEQHGYSVINGKNLFL